MTISGRPAHGKKISGVRHHTSHQRLLRAEYETTTRRARADAIIVPASRPARHLDFAVGLAESSQSVLVVLCSHEARVDEVTERVSRLPGTRSIVVEVPSGYALPGLELLTSTDPELRRASAGRSNDLSVKRNLGLLLAKMLGWQRIVFLDDDIYRISANDIGRLAGLLAYLPVAGMLVTHFPDNSVACHASRHIGNRQGVFASGAVLAAHIERPDLPFFPDIYNEDWLFLHEFASGAGIAVGRTARQLEYDPFEDLGRARREEFGDLLAEGLFALLAGDGTGQAPDRTYWEEFRAVRDDFLSGVLARLERHGERDARVKPSLEAARRQLQSITTDDCLRFLDLWKIDRANWNDTFKRAPLARTVSDALKHLSLDRYELRGVQDVRPTSPVEVRRHGFRVVPRSPRSD